MHSRATIKSRIKENKNMQKVTTKTQQTLLSRLRFRTLAAVVLSLALIIGLVSPLVNADRFEAQIKELQSQNNASQGVLSQLEDQATSYQQVIDGLQMQINSIQAQIDANVAEQVALQKKIDEGQAELERQRAVLAQSVKDMYIKGELSTVEMLATSKNISDFVDSETYRAAVQAKIDTTVKAITKLQNELKDQKAKVEQLLIAQKQQRTDLDVSRSKQAELLSFNQSQQNDYTQKIKSNQSRIAELKAEQAAENARLFGGGGSGTVGGGGYPWGNAACIHTGRVDGACSNYDWAVNGQIYNWNLTGYGYRNCTDWVSWRGGFPAGLGNANTWDDRGPSYGFTVSKSPRQGAAAVSNAGYYGHVMYVERVNGDGSIFISEYNGNGLGTYRTNTLDYVSEGRYKNPSTGAISTLNFVYR